MLADVVMVDFHVLANVMNGLKEYRNKHLSAFSCN